MNSSKKPNLDNYDNMDVENNKPDFVEMCAVELSDYIEEKMENIPKKSSKMYKIWQKEMNDIINIFNSRYGNIYKIIK